MCKNFQIYIFVTWLKTAKCKTKGRCKCRQREIGKRSFYPLNYSDWIKHRQGQSLFAKSTLFQSLLFLFKILFLSVLFVCREVWRSFSPFYHTSKTILRSFSPRFASFLPLCLFKLKFTVFLGGRPLFAFLKIIGLQLSAFRKIVRGIPQCKRQFFRYFEAFYFESSASFSPCRFVTLKLYASISAINFSFSPSGKNEARKLFLASLHSCPLPSLNVSAHSS